MSTSATTRAAASSVVVGLGEPAALDAAVAGAKAANLARALAAGLPVRPGFVVTTAAEHDGDGLEHDRDLAEQWTLVARGGEPLVVRSSSTAEDLGASSMAGQFRSVLDVADWPAFLDAVHEVLASARRPDGSVLPMAVLVQPQLDVAVGGVLFGVDPVTGATDRVVIEAVAGRPDRLVSGQVTAERYVVHPSGRLWSPRPHDHRLLGRRHLRRLARLARRTNEAFGGPQDIEWAFDRADRLWLLQSRPITATGHAAVAGPLLGPGPVAETFPDPLRPLEVDLWVRPLTEGITSALRTALAVSARRLARSPVVTVVGGRVAADLELFGYETTRSKLSALAPRRLVRRARAAWRLGRLRAALPASSAALVAGTDDWLESVPPLADLDDIELLEIVERCRRHLVGLHALEALAATLLVRPEQQPTGTAAALGLDALRVGRAAGLSDEVLRHRHPEVLVLSPPRLGPPRPLPAAPVSATPSVAPASFDDLAPREALRLRGRWVQELAGRAATELGVRLAGRGALPSAEAVALLACRELRAVAAGAAAPCELSSRADGTGAPLPAAFRLDPQGRPVAMVAGAIDGGGLAAGGGRGAGIVVHADELDAALLEPIPPGDRPVLVTGTLDPALATVLPGLAGLVAETGGTLSHLAIVAREQGVPTVVAVPDARRRFPPGTRVLVDGGTGEVRRLPEEHTP